MVGNIDKLKAPVQKKEAENLEGKNQELLEKENHIAKENCSESSRVLLFSRKGYFIG